MTTDADRVVSPGVELALSNGKTLPVRFGYRQLYELEKQFGSVEHIFSELGKGMGGEFFGTFLPALAIGVRKPIEFLLDNLDPSEADSHMEVFGKALEQAFPKQAQAAATANPQTVSPEASNGPITTTSQQFGSGELIPSS